MIQKTLRWTFIGVGSLVALALIFYLVVYLQTQSRIDKVYEVKLQTLTIPNDSLSASLGRHVAEIRGCIGCHGADLSGGVAFFSDSTPIARLYSANLTSGKGGIAYTDQDWIRTLRHGLNKEKRSVWFMPSHEIYHISNQELAALIGFVKRQPPVDKNVPAKSIKPLGRVLVFLGKLPFLTAEMIDHSATYPEKVELAVNASYGQYLAVTCTGCHSATFKGAPAHSPQEPNIPDISSTGNPGKWTEQGFVNLFHTGTTPEGRKLSQYMPWQEFKYSDDELKAVYAFLHEKK